MRNTLLAVLAVVVASLAPAARAQAYAPSALAYAPSHVPCPACHAPWWVGVHGAPQLVVGAYWPHPLRAGGIAGEFYVYGRPPMDLPLVTPLNTGLGRRPRMRAACRERPEVEVYAVTPKTIDLRPSRQGR